MTTVRVRPGRKVERLRGLLITREQLLTTIGLMTQAASQRAFGKQGLAGAEKWKPRGVPNIMGIVADLAAGRQIPERRFSSRPVLRDTGLLARSITFRIISRDTVQVGTAVKYAETHQLGGKSTSPKITYAMQEALWKWLQGQPKKRQKALGFLLDRDYTGRQLIRTIPARPFLGVTPKLREDIMRVLGVRISEVKS